MPKHKFPKGNQFGKYTKRPKTIKGILKEEGYTQSQIREAMVKVSLMSENELKELFSSPDTPAILKAVAITWKNSFKKGIKEAQILLPYIAGAVKQEMEISKPKSKLEERIEELRQEYPEKDYSELEDMAMEEIENLINKKPNE